MKKILVLTAILMVYSFQLKAQGQKLEVEGTIQISDSEDPTPDPGTIRWTGVDFEGWNGLIWVSLTGNAKLGTLSDISGNTYKTITIGNQVWMTENLRVSQLNDGTILDQIMSAEIWGGLSSGAYCWYNNDVELEMPYGKLYNWYAVNTGNLCPAGWHVPDDEDWTTLLNQLGGAIFAGGKMKEAGLAHWSHPNTSAKNENGFTGLPGGLRHISGTFYELGNEGFWWSRSSETDDIAPSRHLSYSSGEVRKIPSHKSYGLSVRCLMGYY